MRESTLHAICSFCYEDDWKGKKLFPIHDAPSERCCYCREITQSGLYVKDSRFLSLPCKGVHPTVGDGWSIKLQDAVSKVTIKKESEPKKMVALKEYKFPWDKMDIGDSFVIKKSEVKNASVSMTNTGRKVLGRQFTMRKISADGTRRIWRIK